MEGFGVWGLAGRVKMVWRGVVGRTGEMCLLPVYCKEIWVNDQRFPPPSPTKQVSDRFHAGTCGCGTERPASPRTPMPSAPDDAPSDLPCSAASWLRATELRPNH